MILNPAIHMEEVGENGFVLINSATKETFRIGLEEGWFLQGYRDEYNFNSNLSWSEEKRKQAEAFFFKKGLLVDETMSVKIEPKMKQQFNITKIKLYECTTEKFFERSRKIFTVLTNRVSQWIYILFIIGAVLFSICKITDIKAVFMHYVKFQESSYAFPVRDMILVYAMILLTMCIHEIFHMVMCEQAGGKVGKAGVMLYFLQPALYCNLNSLYTIESRKKKIIAFMAGIYSQWVTSSIAIVAYSLLDEFFEINADFLLLYALLNLLISLYNLIPFTKLDGYWVLGVLWNVQNLYYKSIKVLLEVLHVIPKKTKRGRGKLLFYSIGAVLFYVLFWTASLTGIYNIVQQIVDHISAIVVIVGLGFFIVQHLFRQMRSIKEREWNR